MRALEGLTVLAIASTTSSLRNGWNQHWSRASHKSCSTGGPKLSVFSADLKLERSGANSIGVLTLGSPTFLVAVVIAFGKEVTRASLFVPELLSISSWSSWFQVCSSLIRRLATANSSPSPTVSESEPSSVPDI